MHKNIIKRCLVLMLLMVFSVQPVSAAPAMGTTDIFQSLSGDGEFISSDYLDNYYLDLRETTMLEGASKATNELANALFQWMKNNGYVSVYLINACFEFDVGEAFKPYINDFQAAAKQSVFDELYWVMLCLTAWSVIREIYKRNMIGAGMAVAKVAVVLALSLALVSYSADLISGISSTTRAVSVGMLSTASGTTASGFAQDAAASLWSTLVHRPYVDLLGGSIITDAQVKQLLSMTPGTPERIDYVRSLNSADKRLFDLNWPGLRLGKIFALIMPLMIKDLLFTLIAILTLAFQFLLIFCVLLAPLVLLFAMVPSLGGFNAIDNWVKRLIEISISSIVLTAMIVFLIRLDQILYSQANIMGWMIVLFIQTVISVFIAWKYNYVLQMATGMMHGRTPRMGVPSLRLPRAKKSQSFRAGPSKNKSRVTQTSAASETAATEKTETENPPPTPPASPVITNMRSTHYQHTTQSQASPRRQLVPASGASYAQGTKDPEYRNVIQLYRATGTDGRPTMYQQPSEAPRAPRASSGADSPSITLLNDSPVRQMRPSAGMPIRHGVETSAGQGNLDSNRQDPTVGPNRTSAQPQRTDSAHAVHQEAPMTSSSAMSSNVRSTASQPPSLSSSTQRGTQQRTPRKIQKDPEVSVVKMRSSAQKK